MQLKNAIAKFAVLRFMTGRLDVRSALGRYSLPEAGWMTDPEEIVAELDRVTGAVDALRSAGGAKPINAILGELSHVKDIRRTASRLVGGEVPDDIELYEIKAFALSAATIRGLLPEAGVDFIYIPDLEPIVEILDPEGSRIPHFYVYDSYCADLAAVRKEMKPAEGTEKERLFAESTAIEQRVREDLTKRLRPHGEALESALSAVCDLDILLAKAGQACEMGLCRPEISHDETSYKGLFNPEEAELLRRRGKEFQPVDIDLPAGPTLITGANMGGKTVVLRSAALAQLLCQFGFFVPVRRATIAPVDEVVLLSEAHESGGGLSSFASEITRLGELIGKVRGGERILALVDEPARTTNPTEGKALVAALLDFMAEHRVRSLVTSHFSGLENEVRRLRVKGFTREDVNVTIGDIQDYMDYSLVADMAGDVPHEALRIARMLGMDEQVRRRAQHYLDNEKSEIKE